MTDWDYPEGPYIEFDGGAMFIRVCENCGRFVKADSKIFVSEAEGLSKRTNATCKKCGRTHMSFCGFM